MNMLTHCSFNVQCLVSSFLWSGLYLREKAVTLPFWSVNKKRNWKYIRKVKQRKHQVLSWRSIHSFSRDFISSSCFVQTWDMVTTELSSVIASSTSKRFGRVLFFKIAVASSSLWKKSTGSGPCKFQQLKAEGINWNSPYLRLAY